MIKELTFFLMLVALYSCNPGESKRPTENQMDTTVDYVYTCNLKNNPDSIASYKYYHSEEGVWPEVVQTFESSGASSVKIYLSHTRLVMIVSLPESLSWEAFSKRYESSHPDEMKKWDELMGGFQTPPPFAEKGQTWVQMEQIFNFQPKQK